ncbi:hypothetical protein Ddye_024784 [Dipteronia dyeriana]|uniref:KIB1-4 beta-propeller domain-containing protein n=1 Tax=Dipteronia dyeriana TaxID=168575 RepID=A0AAD9WTY5_9ROSI|nr:hypothetical protein Ddye_024784 [Dipteronia dyeriana]
MKKKEKEVKNDDDNDQQQKILITITSKINDVVANQFPWLLLPHSLYDNNLRFFDLSAGGIYNISLPENLRGGLCCGSSKGWLAMAIGEEFDPILVLFNPISGVELRLPPVKKQSHRFEISFE